MPGVPGRSGRLRKPTAQHQIDGTYQKCRHESRGDNVEAVGWPEKPAGLTPMQDRLWDEVTSCLPAQCIGKLDTASLRDMCRWYGVYTDLLSLVEAEPNDGPTMRNLCMAFDRFWKYAQDYGLTSVARARLDVPVRTRNEKMDALQEILESRN